MVIIYHGAFYYVVGGGHAAYELGWQTKLASSLVNF